MTTLKHEVGREAKEREAFERDAEPMGFDLTRYVCAAPEPWAEYNDIDTGHRWGGWLARASYEDKGWRMQVLEGFAEGRLSHMNRGLCPDHVAGHDSRDPECQICQALPAAPSSHDGEGQ